MWPPAGPFPGPSLSLTHSYTILHVNDEIEQQRPNTCYVPVHRSFSSDESTCLECEDRGKKNKEKRKGKKDIGLPQVCHMAKLASSKQATSKQATLALAAVAAAVTHTTTPRSLPSHQEEERGT